MTKYEFIARLSDKCAVSRRVSEKIVNEVFASLREVILKEGVLKMQNFGTFKVKVRPERKGRNPSTGEEVFVPSKKDLTFHPSRKLRDDLNR